MESKIADAISIKYQPVALIWSDEKPAEAMQFKEGKWGCIMWLAAGAAKGKTAVCDRKSFGCYGGGTRHGLRRSVCQFSRRKRLFLPFSFGRQ